MVQKKSQLKIKSSLNKRRKMMHQQSMTSLLSNSELEISYLVLSTLTLKLHISTVRKLIWAQKSEILPPDCRDMLRSKI